MMKFVLVLMLLSISLFSKAAVKIEEELFVVKKSPEIIKDLILTGSVIIDHVTSNGFEVYGPKGLKDHLDRLGIINFELPKISKLMLDNYPTYLEMTNKLNSIVKKYPRFMKMMSIGKSVRGRDLWVIKISDNVEVDEVEPEFKYISSMHGDEITGRELMVRFIEDLGDNYGKNSDITKLINNTEIYIMPSMNPDGSEARSRANASGFDLNRSFPNMSSDRNEAKDRPVEVQAIMKFQAERKFSLSANFHGGTIVANYPWDSTYDRHPLDQLVQELSLKYADRNPEMRDSKEFSHGITNGADWYIVKGGMQDWSYFWYNDLQITVELSHMKWPSYSDIPGFYKSNRDSILKYMELVHQGAGFRFARSNVSGTVRIKKLLPKESDLGSFAFSGSEFYKVLESGQYEFKVESIQGNKTFKLEVREDQVLTNGNYLLI